MASAAFRRPIGHAVALDLRGHGDSEWPVSSRGYQHEDFLTDLAGLLRHLDKEPLTIIGHSLGGSMCLLYAGAFPEKVNRMILLESLGPFARADDDVPDIVAERLKGRDYVEIPFPHESLETAAELMTKLGASHLVVVDDVAQRPVGVVSTLDLAGVLGRFSA